MSEKTTSRVLLNSDRADAKLLLEKAKWAAEQGGKFEIINTYEDSNWYTKVTIWWPTTSHEAHK